MVCSGIGLLGVYVVRTLSQRGASEVFMINHNQYDLHQGEDIRRALGDYRPQTVIHLAARVGGIGANRTHPAEFFHDNLMMGIPFLPEAWWDVRNFDIGRICLERVRLP
jgi:GDP-L-fucose synthase